MYIERDGLKYELTFNELYEAHKEFVINFMTSQIAENYNVLLSKAKELAEEAYDYYSDGRCSAEGEAIDYIADKYDL